MHEPFEDRRYRFGWDENDYYGAWRMAGGCRWWMEREFDLDMDQKYEANRRARFWIFVFIHCFGGYGYEKLDASTYCGEWTTKAENRFFTRATDWISNITIVRWTIVRSFTGISTARSQQRCRRSIFWVYGRYSWDVWCGSSQSTWGVNRSSGIRNKSS